MRRIISQLVLISAAAVGVGQSASGATVTAEAVKANYMEVAHAVYQDSLDTAKVLQGKVEDFLAKPSEAGLKAAREAWIAARVPYQQSEVFRFGNPAVDEWEGKVNAWPLDEGLLDYVQASFYGQESEENPLYTANLVANPKLSFDGRMVDASQITKDLLRQLHEAADSDTNVATGYHAVEFMLWGQDLNGNGPGAGNRPHTDYSLTNCSHMNCDRRRQLLSVLTQLLVEDLEEMVASWANGGAARRYLEQRSGSQVLAVMMTGMGSLAYGELAGERMKLGLLLHDPEEEHDCFSDNTHFSHHYNVQGILNVYNGSYTRVAGQKLAGASIGDLVKAKALPVHNATETVLSNALKSTQALVDSAEAGTAYDQLLAAGNEAGNKLVADAVSRLVDLTKQLETVMKTLKLKNVSIEGSDSLAPLSRDSH